MSVKKMEALILFDAGESKTSIRKKLNIKVKKLNKWISEDSRSVKERALQMYFFKIPKKKICSCLLVSKFELNNWVDDAEFDIWYKALSNKKEPKEYLKITLDNNRISKNK